eukprot:1957940-Pleurochrysis_carterae.AAC.1
MAVNFGVMAAFNVLAIVISLSGETMPPKRVFRSGQVVGRLLDGGKRRGAASLDRMRTTGLLAILGSGSCSPPHRAVSLSATHRAKRTFGCTF